MGPEELPLEQAMAGSSRREELKEETREHKGKRTTGQEGKNRADAGTRGHMEDEGGTEEEEEGHETSRQEGTI